MTMHVPCQIVMMQHTVNIHYSAAIGLGEVLADQ